MLEQRERGREKRKRKDAQEVRSRRHVTYVTPLSLYILSTRAFVHYANTIDNVSSSPPSLFVCLFTNGVSSFFIVPHSECVRTRIASLNGLIAPAAPGR